MTQTSRHDLVETRVLSRRTLMKRGIPVTVGALATMTAARTGSAAVTPLDVKSIRSAIPGTSNAVTPLDVKSLQSAVQRVPATYHAVTPLDVKSIRGFIARLFGSSRGADGRTP